MATSNPIVQSIGTPQIIVIDQGKPDEEKEDTSKEEEKVAIQTLVELPKKGTPTKTLQKPSTEVIPLQISTPCSSSTKVSRVLHYGNLDLDEEIVIPTYESKAITIEQIIEMQDALNRRRRQ